MDLESFKEDLACALGRPEEWRVGDESRFLIHRSTGINVYAHGQTYRSVSSSEPYYQICTAPQETVTRCWGAVIKREIEVRQKNSARDRKEFLDSFPGFRS